MTTKIAYDYSYIKDQLAKLEAEKAKVRALPEPTETTPELSYDANYLHWGLTECLTQPSGRS